MNNQIPEPHTKLYSIKKMDKYIEEVVKVEHTVAPFFTVAETIQLMERYAHLTYIGVQASRAADRCDRENNEKGIIKYIRLMTKADAQLRELKSKMSDWSKLK